MHMFTRARLVALATLTLGTLGVACGDKEEGGEDTSADSGAIDGGDDSGEDDDDDDGPEEITGTVSGTVTVQLYESGDDGERDELSWADSEYYDDGTINWPFGNIYVGAYHTNDGGNDVYVGSTVIGSPDDSNPYTLDYTAQGDQSVWVYASIDMYGDTIVGSGDPRGVYPIEVPLTDGDAITGVDITILATHRSSGGGCDTVSITGDARVTVSYASGNVATMVVDQNGAGPYVSTIDTPTATATGAEAAYGLTSCQSYGAMNIVGAWDSNDDGMFAPDDTWGSYVVSGADANPLTIGATDLSGIDVEIPFGDGPGVSVVPFVTLSGDVSVAGGAFDDLPAGTTVYVAALKYRPTGGFDITTSDAIYDMDTFEWPDLTGESAKSFSLTVPAGTVAYLWAYADVDVDGNVNESGEPVASGGIDDNGRVELGTSSQGGLALELATAGTR